MVISVIIPVYNDREGLRDTLESLLAQEAVGGVEQEIIIADNGSDDGTWRLALDYAESHSSRVIAIREDQIQGSYAARNRGIEASTGEILCFIDADMRAPADYLRLVEKRFRGRRVDYLACNVQIDEDQRTLASLYNCLTGFPVERYLERGHYAPTCCLCVRREVIEKLGAFDERLESGGDMEFGQRVYDAGLNQEFAAEILLRHPPRRRFRALLNKQRRIGRGHAQLSHLHPGRYALFSKLYLGTTRYFHPVNPLGLRAESKKRRIRVAPVKIAALSVYHIPLTWAGAIAYIAEARRLKKR